MMTDETRQSKWDPIYEGPFTVVRTNRSGSYVLRDRIGETLKRTVTDDQLKLTGRKGDDPAITTDSLRVKDIMDDRSEKGKVKYLVQWAEKSVEPSWEPVSNFDDITIIKNYWKKKRPTRRRANN